MPIPTDEQELTALFAELGARNPDAWAKSQINEGIPQLLRFLFLRNAWANIPVEGQTAWIDKTIASASQRPADPYAGLGLALAECRSKGVSDQTLNEMARCLQAQTLFNIGYLIDDPWPLPESVSDVTWGLFQTDEQGQPIGSAISGLHESVLELDPTGREMRPQQAKT